MSTLRGLAPLAAGLVAYGAVVWFLLARDAALGRWLFAAFLVAHGAVHALFVVPPPSEADASAGGVE